MQSPILRETRERSTTGQSPVFRLLNWLIWLGLAALVAVLALFKVSNYDIWWHLKTGEYILAHHLVPTRDVFSFLAHGRAWVTHEWLFEVLAYLVYRLGGINAVTILKTVTVLLTFAVLGLTLRRLKVNTLIATGLLAVGAFLVTFRAFERPHIVTELFCAVYMLVLLAGTNHQGAENAKKEKNPNPELNHGEHGEHRGDSENGGNPDWNRQGAKNAKGNQNSEPNQSAICNLQSAISNRADTRVRPYGRLSPTAYRLSPGLLLWLLPLQLIWANMHSGMVFGLTIVALFIAGEGMKRIRAKHKGTKAQESAGRWGQPLGGHPSEGCPLETGAVPLLGLLAGLVLVSLLNPNTYRVLMYPFMITGEASFRSQIGELQSPLGAAYRSSTFFAALVVLALAGIASFLANRRRADLTGLLFFLVFGALGLMALRNLPVFAIVAIPFIAVNLQEAASPPTAYRIPPTACRRTSCLLPAILTLLAIVALIVLVSVLGVNVAGLRRKPGLGVSEGMFPIRATEFIDRNHVQGNVFNTMEFGGYLIWHWYPERQVFIDGRLDVYGHDLFDVYSRVLRTAPDAESILSANGVNCLVLAQPAQNDAATRSYIGRTLALRPGWSLVYWDDIALVYVREIPAHQDLIARHGYHAILPILLGTPQSSDSSQSAVRSPQSSDPRAVLAEAQRAHNESPGPGTEAALGFAWLGLNRIPDALQSFQHALQLNPSQTSAFQGLARIDAANKDLPALVKVLNRWIAVEPGNALVRYNLGRAYFEKRDYAAAERALRQALRIDNSLAAAHELLGEVLAREGKTPPAGR